MGQISVKPLAREDVRQHVARIANAHPDAANRLIAAVEDAFKTLAANPELGTQTTTHNSALAGLRFWTIRGFRNYVIFYRFQEAELEVLRVLHGARDWEAVLNA